MNRDVIIALDFPSKETALEFVDKFNFKLYVKVGMELYYASGKEIFEELKNRGHKIFFDIKLHDIPNTVHKAMKVISNYNIDMVNVHALGGKDMMENAKKAFQGTTTKVIGVTQLTSTSKEELNLQQGIPGEILDNVLKLANLAKDSGLDGVVCSSYEALKINDTINDFLTVVPGIRRECDAVGDQHRIMTPKKARLQGCDFIVVGRPITQDLNPVKTYCEIKKDFLGE